MFIHVDCFTFDSDLNMIVLKALGGGVFIHVDCFTFDSHLNMILLRTLGGGVFIHVDSPSRGAGYIIIILLPNCLNLISKHHPFYR